MTGHSNLGKELRPVGFPSGRNIPLAVAYCFVPDGVDDWLPDDPEVLPEPEVPPEDVELFWVLPLRPLSEVPSLRPLCGADPVVLVVEPRTFTLVPERSPRSRTLVRDSPRTVVREDTPTPTATPGP